MKRFASRNNLAIAIALLALIPAASAPEPEPPPCPKCLRLKSIVFLPLDVGKVAKMCTVCHYTELPA